MDLDILSAPTDVFAAKRLTEEAEFLLACLQQGGADAPDTLDWDLLLALAKSHGVLPLFCRSYTGPLPEDILRRFHDQWTFSLFLANELDELLGEFEKLGIEALPIKGPVMAELLYGNVSLRPSNDLDLVLRPEDYARGETRLLELGFVPVDEADDYHRDFERNGVFVELHFGIASPSAPRFDLFSARARARTVNFRGHSIRVLSPIDQILYLALHGLKHRFSRLIWVLDVVRALESLSERDSSSLLDQAGAQRLKNVVLLACEIASRSFGAKLPAGADAAIHAKPNLTRIAASMADGLLTTIAVSTTSVLDTRHYLQVADDPGWSERFQFFLPTQQDYRWAARHGIHPKCASLVRPFRLVAKYGPAFALRTLFPR